MVLYTAAAAKSWDGYRRADRFGGRDSLMCLIALCEGLCLLWLLNYRTYITCFSLLNLRESCGAYLGIRLCGCSWNQTLTVRILLNLVSMDCVIILLLLPQAALVQLEELTIWSIVKFGGDLEVSRTIVETTT